MDGYPPQSSQKTHLSHGLMAACPGVDPVSVRVKRHLGSRLLPTAGLPRMCDAVLVAACPAAAFSHFTKG